VGFFCTDVEASVEEVLATVADRFALETAFRDCKQVVGVGQQQVRFVWANIGAFHVWLWTFTMTEAWAWSRSEVMVVDREASPSGYSTWPHESEENRGKYRSLVGTKT
jgi:hypothetical protein